MEHVSKSLEKGIRVAVEETLHSPQFINQLVEEIIDRLEGVDDTALVEAMREADTNDLVDMEEVYKSLRD